MLCAAGTVSTLEHELLKCFVNSGDCSFYSFLVVLSWAWGCFLTCMYRLICSQSLKGTPSRCPELSAWTSALFSGFCHHISCVDFPEFGLFESAKPLRTGFPHTALQPRLKVAQLLGLRVPSRRQVCKDTDYLCRRSYGPISFFEPFVAGDQKTYLASLCL